MVLFLVTSDHLVFTHLAVHLKELNFVQGEAEDERPQADCPHLHNPAEGHSSLDPLGG